jgi:hypothetical protein
MGWPMADCADFAAAGNPCVSRAANSPARAKRRLDLELRFRSVTTALSFVSCWSADFAACFVAASSGPAGSVEAQSPRVRGRRQQHQRRIFVQSLTCQSKSKRLQ